jgi:hypothetical protein
MKKEYLGKTKNNLSVYVDMESSHAITHFAHHPKLIESVKKIIPTLEVNDDTFRMNFDMGEIVGKTDLIETTDADEIVYAMRPLRQVYSRFVKNKKSIPTSWITIDLRKAAEKEYYLYTAFVGKLTPSFPGGNYLPEHSKEFWSKHALVWESQDVVSGTETKECPW